MRRLYCWTISSQARASPLTQRRIRAATAWASSNPHSPELLVFQAEVATAVHPGALHHSWDTSMWGQKFFASKKKRIVAGGLWRRVGRVSRSKRNGGPKREQSPTPIAGTITFYRKLQLEATSTSGLI